MAKLCMGCMGTVDDSEKTCPHCGYAEGTPPLEAYHIVPGTVLKERYIIGRGIGFGGFGVTYLAYDQVLEQRIAIKEYLPGEFSTRMPNQLKVTIYSGDKEEQYLTGRDKFIDEARRLARLQKVPEVVHVYDCFEENQTAYIVMEYLEGESLKERLERTGKMSVEQALPIVFSVLRALEAVHGADILHRDIAPDNIFITKEDQVKLLDFGAARFATTTHSRSLTVLIKPGYTPEEQYRSRGDQGTWTDVYAVAATFYRMITGIVPEDALERSVKDTLKEPSKLGVAIGPNTEIALMNALNVKIDGRTPTANQFKEELLSNVVKRVVVKKQQIDIGKWPLGIKLAVTAALSGILIFAGLLLSGIIHFDMAKWGGNTVPEGKTRVPNLINEEMNVAIERGEEAGLTVQVYDKQYSNEIPKDRVLSQDIRGGTLADLETILGIVISAGIERTRVPGVIGMEQEVGIQSLKDAGLVVTSEEKEYRAAPGTIGWQSLDAQTETDTGTEIEIIISKGIPGGDSSIQEQVDNLVGMDYTEASDQMLEKYIYLVNVGGSYDDNVPAGSIISQEPEAGSTLNQNSNIRVVLSLGRERMTVPDVQFKGREDAEAMLTEAGLSAEIRWETSTTVAAGSVVRQGTEAGEQIEKGTAVVIYISTGVPEEPAVNQNTGNIGGVQETVPVQEVPQTAAPETVPETVPETDPSRNPVFDLLQ